MSQNKETWVLLDTETTGIVDPIYILEIYAQKMNGFEPVGEPLHIYINHNVLIPPESIAIHGYTQEFIAEKGINPNKAHELLELYSGSSPICSHNLGYDWCRCLLPERQRLNRSPKLKKGFCTLQLFRRALEYQETYRLADLREKYKLSHTSHSAKGDVLTVIDILQSKVAPKLVENKIEDIPSIKKLCTTTPISLCREKLGLDSPYVLEDTNKTVEEIVLETLAGTLDLTEIEDPKIRELDSWLTKHKKDNTNKVLTDNIKTIVSQGIIAPEKRFEMLELIQPNLPMTPITPIRGKSGSPSKKGDYRTPASDKQISYLKKIHRILGKKYPETEKPLTKKEASDLIDKLKAKVKGVQRTTTNVSKNKLDLGIE